MSTETYRAALLARHVAAHVDCGCREISGSLGIQKMPSGYALMLNADESYFYWLRSDGASSRIFSDKWTVYREAKADSETNI